MDIRWIENARAEFSRIYGPKRGAAVCNAVIPGVMGDFRKVLMAAQDGQTVRETYRVDDGRSAVCITGRRQGGACIIMRIEINGAAVSLGPAELIL